jgi:hypothetical protein
MRLREPVAWAAETGGTRFKGRSADRPFPFLLEQHTTTCFRYRELR